MSRKKSKDRRVRRTRALLQNSLLVLLQKKRLNKIRIKEITEQADLSRPAFYLHFDSKEALLFSYIDDIFAQIYQAVFEDVQGANIMDLKSLMTYYYQQWVTHAEALHWVMQVENKDMLIERLRTHIVAFKIAYIKHLRPNETTPEPAKLVMDFITGGCYMLLKGWVEEGMTKSPEEMAELTYRCFNGD